MKGFTIYPDRIFLFGEPSASTGPLIEHETVHTQQMRADGLITFWSSYLFQFIFFGYDEISYEKEAYAKVPSLPKSARTSSQMSILRLVLIGVILLILFHLYKRYINTF